MIIPFIRWTNGSKASIAHYSQSFYQFVFTIFVVCKCTKIIL